MDPCRTLGITAHRPLAKQSLFQQKRLFSDAVVGCQFLWHLRWPSFLDEGTELREDWVLCRRLEVL